MCAILQLVGQISKVDQVGNDCTCCKLGQVGLHQWDFFFYFRALIHNTQNSLSTIRDSLDPDSKTYTGDVESDSSKTDLQQLVTSNDTLSTELMDQDTCEFLILIGPIQRMDHNLVQHLRHKMLGRLHLLYSIHSVIGILAVVVIHHQCCLKKQEKAK